MSYFSYFIAKIANTLYLSKVFDLYISLVCDFSHKFTKENIRLSFTLVSIILKGFKTIIKGCRGVWKDFLMQNIFLVFFNYVCI
jgi:hypothetical protein